MNGVYLRFYTHENRKVHGLLFYEWLLEQAKKLGIHGGTAFKAMAGFGQHGVVHEAKFFELAGDLTVEVEFIVSEEEAERLLGLVRSCRVRVFYARFPADFGIIEGEH
jgi:PII-like signaling protein